MDRSTAGWGQTLKAGDVVRLDRVASPQFVRAITVRVIRVLDWSTYGGWLWLEGYQLNDSGDAMFSRCLYVRCDGIVLCSAANGSGSHPPRISGHNQRPVDERKPDD